MPRAATEGGPYQAGRGRPPWRPVRRHPRGCTAMSQLAERIAQFRKMATEDPDNDLGHFRLGQLLMEDNQFAEAVKSFERTAEINPHFSKVYQLLGECLIKLDRKDKAVEVLMNGWTIADERGDKMPRDAMGKLLQG